MQKPYGKLKPHLLMTTFSYQSDPIYSKYVDEWILAYERVQILKIELENYHSRDHIDNIYYQSGAEVGDLKTGTIDDSVVTEHDILTDIGGEETQTVNPYVDKTSMVNVSNNLDTFFNRPVKVSSGTIPILTDFNLNFDPWDLYTTDPAVRAKLRNMSFIRATVCIRVAVSGTPFDYGRLMVSCIPFPGDNAVYTELFRVGTIPSLNVLQRQYLSQQRISTVIDLKENKPVELEMPWIGLVPMGRLWNKSNSAITSVTSYADLAGMWRVVIKDLTQRNSVAPTPTDVQFYVYAYLKNVQVGVPTGSQTQIVYNSGDERKVGPVEKVSSTLYAITSSLSNAPVIGVYARASSYAFGAMSSMAALFGWSAPQILTKPMRVKNEAYQNGAACIQNDTGQKISFDPEQELAISTEYVSTFKDELVISDFCARQAYLYSFTWTPASSPGTILSTMAIHPAMNYGVTTSPSGTKNVLPTPMHFFSQMFDYWHGKIVVTFEAVISNFHRGKLLITYDPNVLQYANIASNLNLNKQYTHVWDIQETQRYSVCVDWNYFKAWAENIPQAESYNELVGFTTDRPLSFADAVNGILIISSFNALQSPISDQISINVYVHAEDMMFNRPTAKNIPVNRAIRYNSGKEVTNTSASCIEITKSNVAEQGMHNHFFGEQPISIRSLLKRFVQTNEWLVPAGSVDGQFVLEAPAIPNTFGNVGFNYTGSRTTSYFGHIRQAFLAMRGGVRKRLIWSGNNEMYRNDIRISLLQQGDNPTNTITNIGQMTVMTPEGSIVFEPITNNGIEFEIPYYSNTYYSFACANDFYTPAHATATTNVLRGYQAEFFVPNTSGSNVINEVTATAEDFQFAYFVGCVPYVSA